MTGSHTLKITFSSLFLATKCVHVCYRLLITAKLGIKMEI